MIQPPEEVESQKKNRMKLGSGSKLGARTQNSFPPFCKWRSRTLSDYKIVSPAGEKCLTLYAFYFFFLSIFCSVTMIIITFAENVQATSWTEFQRS